MPSTYSPLLRAELQASGENDTTWGTKTNTNIATVLEQAIAGISDIILVDSDYTLTTGFGVDDEARKAILSFTGTLTNDREVTCPATSKLYVVRNNTDGGFGVSLIASGGAGVLVPNGSTKVLFCDGTNVVDATPPTTDASITPSKIDTTSTHAWRLNSCLGINYNQTHQDGYGVLGIDGVTGSYASFYRGGANIGTITASTAGFGLEAGVNQSILLKTSGTTRVSIGASGSVAVAGTLAATTLNATNFSGAALALSGNAVVAGTVSANGYAGITSANVRTALGYAPVQQGTGFTQNAAYTVKIGWNDSIFKLRCTVEATDLGNVMFEGTQGIFIPCSGGNGVYDMASNSAGTSYVSAIQIRELNHAGAQGNSPVAMPRLAFHWGGVSAAQIGLQSNAIISFMNNPGTSQESLYANNGYFVGDVIAFYSDMRLKTKVADITGARAILRKLDGFYYKENDIAKSVGYSNKRMQIGLSAQQVKEVLPELIDLAPFDCESTGDSANPWTSKSGQNYMTVNYQRMVPVLVQAIKEQDAELESLKLKVERMHQQLVVLMNKVGS